MGWFIGQGRANSPLWCSSFSISPTWRFGAFFVLSLGMTADGVGLAALIAEFSAALLGLVCWPLACCGN